MRNDERYNPKPQSCQLEIFGLGDKGEADAEDARRWIDENPGAWNYMVENAFNKHRSQSDGFTA